MTKHSIQLLFLFCIISRIGSTQNIDSLKHLLDSGPQNDLRHLILLNDLSKTYGQRSENVNALMNANYAVLLGEGLLKNKLNPALEKSIRGELSNAFNSTALIHYANRNYSKALHYHFRSLKIAEELDDKKKEARSYNNLGLVYRDLNELDKALNFYFKALKIREEVKDSVGLSNAYGNIGTVYFLLKNSEKALNFQFKSLLIFEKIGDKYEIGNCYNNIGIIYAQCNQNEKALEYYNKSLKIKLETGNEEGVATTYGNISEHFIKIKDYAKAKEFAMNSLKVSQKIRSLGGSVAAYNYLSQIHSGMNQPGKALEYYKLYISTKDSLDNTENTKKTVQAEMNHEFEMQISLQKIEEEKKELLHTEELRRQRLLLFSILGILVLSFIFSLFMIRNFRQKQKANSELQAKNKQVENAYQLIEQKNKEVYDSIRYAKRIQQAILQDQNEMNKNFPEHFLFFKPKDIVSGDFYWMREKRNYIYLAVADCTGHGVPGAFMSMLGISFLNEINAKEQLFSPAEILDQLREKVIHDLHQTSREEDTKDGMDISLLRLNMQTNELQWAGANNSIYLVHEGKLREIKGDKQPIGHYAIASPFTNHSYSAEKGTYLYMFTDGFPDQFGGPKGKKFMYRRLEESILAHAALSTEDQKNTLQKIFEDWKLDYEQVDDICVIGLRI